MRYRAGALLKVFIVLLSAAQAEGIAAETWMLKGEWEYYALCDSSYRPDFHTASNDVEVFRDLGNGRAIIRSVARMVDARRGAPLPAAAPDGFAEATAPWYPQDVGKQGSIDELAGSIIGDARTVEAAVGAIGAWVRDKVSYSLGVSTDPLEIAKHGRAYCEGYANLTAALLRAAGVPAVKLSCYIPPDDGWGFGNSGGGHAFIAYYYPEVGWLCLDPQSTSGYVDPYHLVGFSGRVYAQYRQAPEAYATDFAEEPKAWESYSAAGGNGGRRGFALRMIGLDGKPIECSPLLAVSGKSLAPSREYFTKNLLGKSWCSMGGEQGLGLKADTTRVAAALSGSAWRSYFAAPGTWPESGMELLTLSARGALGVRRIECAPGGLVEASFDLSGGGAQRLRMFDPSSGKPLADQRLTIRLDGRSLEATTGDDGWIAIAFQDAGGEPLRGLELAISAGGAEYSIAFEPGAAIALPAQDGREASLRAALAAARAASSRPRFRLVARDRAGIADPSLVRSASLFDGPKERRLSLRGGLYLAADDLEEGRSYSLRARIGDVEVQRPIEPVQPGEGTELEIKQSELRPALVSRENPFDPQDFSLYEYFAEGAARWPMASSGGLVRWDCPSGTHTISDNASRAGAIRLAISPGTPAVYAPSSMSLEDYRWAEAFRAGGGAVVAGRAPGEPGSPRSGMAVITDERGDAARYPSIDSRGFFSCSGLKPATEYRLAFADTGLLVLRSFVTDEAGGALLDLSPSGDPIGCSNRALRGGKGTDTVQVLFPLQQGAAETARAYPLRTGATFDLYADGGSYFLSTERSLMGASSIQAGAIDGRIDAEGTARLAPDRSDEGYLERSRRILARAWPGADGAAFICFRDSIPEGWRAASIELRAGEDRLPAAFDSQGFLRAAAKAGTEISFRYSRRGLFWEGRATIDGRGPEVLEMVPSEAKSARLRVQGGESLSLAAPSRGAGPSRIDFLPLAPDERGSISVEGAGAGAWIQTRDGSIRRCAYDGRTTRIPQDAAPDQCRAWKSLLDEAFRGRAFRIIDLRPLGKGAEIRIFGEGGKALASWTPRDDILIALDLDCAKLGLEVRRPGFFARQIWSAEDRGAAVLVPRSAGEANIKLRLAGPARSTGGGPRQLLSSGFLPWQGRGRPIAATRWRPGSLAAASGARALDRRSPRASLLWGLDGRTGPQGILGGARSQDLERRDPGLRPAGGRMVGRGRRKLPQGRPRARRRPVGDHRDEVKERLGDGRSEIPVLRLHQLQPRRRQVGPLAAVGPGGVSAAATSIVGELAGQVPQSIKPVFRDATDIGLGSLEKNLRRELEDSRFLIVVCSPRSAGSEWVNREIEHFIQLGRADRIIPFIVEGSPDAGDPALQCYPPALRSLEHDVLGASVAELGRAKALVKIVANILGLKFDQLWQRHERRERKRRTLLASSLALSALIAGGIGFALFDYYRVKQDFYADYVDRWGLPEGIGRLGAEQVSHRNGSYRFSYSQRKLRRVEYVNSAGRLRAIEHTELGDRPSGMVFSYSDKDGRLSQAEYTDERGRTRLKLKYAGSDYLYADFVSNDKEENAFALGTRTGIDEGAWKPGCQEQKSNITRYAYRRDGLGHIVQVLYKRDNRNAPAKDGDGIFGKAYRLDAMGRVIRITYLDEKGEPWTMQDGLAGRRYSYDSAGNLTQAIYVDARDRPMRNSQHVAIYRDRFDAWGNTIESHAFDPEGKPTLKSDGYCGYRAEFDRRGNATKYLFFGADDRPCIQAGGVAEARYEYDDRGYVVRTAFYGTNGEPCLSKNGNSGYASEYDGAGNLIRTSLFGIDGKPCLDVTGAAGAAQEYDARGNIVRISYFGVDGKPCINKDGIAACADEYDDRGDAVEESYFGIDGKPSPNRNGYACIKVGYDDRGNVIEKGYFDAEGNPCLAFGDYAGFIDEFDDRGNNTRTSYFGVDGRPCFCGDGYASSISGYDERGNRVRMSYFGVDGKPCAYKDGYAGWSQEYDNRGNCTKGTFFGIDGKPCLNALGIAAFRWEYDDRGNGIRERYFGVDGKPRSSAEGIAGLEFIYDDRGKCVRKESFGVDGKPCLGKDGICAYAFKYDSWGNCVEQRCFNASGEPCEDKQFGCAAIAAEYDDHGRKVSEGAHDRRGEPIVSACGAAKVKQSYDERGNVISISNFGPDGKPCLTKEGYSVKATTYNAWDKPETTSFLGTDGKPVDTSYGVAVISYSYNDRGELVREIARDLSGLELTSALVIASISPHSPADAKGLKVGDLIVRYGPWNFFKADGGTADYASCARVAQTIRKDKRAAVIWRNGSLVRIEFDPGLAGFQFQGQYLKPPIIERIKADFMRSGYAGRERP